MAIVTGILTDVPQVGESVNTRYGQSAPMRRDGDIVYCHPAVADPRATIWALKEAGVKRLWLCESVGALSPLLEVGDWVVADDYIDGTHGHLYTYFDEQPGGYVQQVPPFDPDSRAALLQAASHSARLFKRGVYACVSHTRLETPAEALFWERAGAHVVGHYLSPYLTLAREVEMAVAVLAQVTRAGGKAEAVAPLESYLPIIMGAMG